METEKMTEKTLVYCLTSQNALYPKEAFSGTSQECFDMANILKGENPDSRYVVISESEKNELDALETEERQDRIFELLESQEEDQEEETGESLDELAPKLAELLKAGNITDIDALMKQLQAKKRELKAKAEIFDKMASSRTVNDSFVVAAFVVSNSENSHYNGLRTITAEAMKTDKGWLIKAYENDTCRVEKLYPGACDGRLRKEIKSAMSVIAKKLNPAK